MDVTEEKPTKANAELQEASSTGVYAAVYFVDSKTVAVTVVLHRTKSPINLGVPRAHTD